MTVNDLADFIFLRNSTNKHVDININGIRNTRDLFGFCLDMLCKGLILLFGRGNRLAIKDLTEDDFWNVRMKLRCVGIDCSLEIYPLDEPLNNVMDMWTQNFLNVQKVRHGHETANLRDYSFDLQTTDSVYKIRFELLHNVIDVPQNMIL